MNAEDTFKRELIQLGCFSPDQIAFLLGAHRLKGSVYARNLAHKARVAREAVAATRRAKAGV